MPAVSDSSPLILFARIGRLDLHTQPLRLARQGQQPYRRAVIACDDIRSMVAAGIPPIVAMTQAPWRYEEIATGHWPMLSAPVELAAALDRIGRA